MGVRGTAAASPRCGFPGTHEAMQDQTAIEAADLLVFELDDARYALHLECVREVVRAVLITPLPGSPAVVEGVIDVRGATVPVYDLRTRFGLPPRPLHPDERLVIAWTGERLVAIRCDRTDWIAHAVPQRLDPDLRLLADDSAIAGTARLPDGIVLIHDLATFLDDAARVTLEEALSALQRHERG
jgi:purine-binding chemotaxis protein CheW